MLLGLWHDNRVPNEINIFHNFDNIINGAQGTSKSEQTLTLLITGVPYDLGSVMHYGPKFIFLFVHSIKYLYILRSVAF